MRIIGDLHFQGHPQLQDLIEPQIAEGFFHIDVDGLSLALQELPWIERASVRRVWPDDLVITLTEQQPFALWNERAVLNPHGVLFHPEEVAQEGLEHLPRFSGPIDTEKMVVKHYREYLRLVADGQLELQKLSLDRRRAWELYFSNGMHLKLGKENMHERLERFMGIYADVVEPRLNKIASLDLRYTNGFALRWRKESSPKV